MYNDERCNLGKKSWQCHILITPFFQFRISIQDFIFGIVMLEDLIMDTLILDKETLTTLNSFLANQLNASPIDVVRQALNEYVKKIQRKNCLMSYAWILEVQEADAILNN